MLVELFGKNFGCFRDEFRLSLVATNIDRGDPRGVVEVPLEGEEEPLRLLRCAAIYGPNASGKSTVLRAASALGFLIRHSATFPSDEEIGPFEPFLLDNESASDPVHLGVIAVIDGQIYEYSVAFSDSRIAEERLAQIGPGRETVLIDRHEQDVTGSWTSDRQYSLVLDSFRPNALLLSLADALAPALAKGIAVGIRQLLLFHDNAEVSAFTWHTSPVASRAAEDSGGFGEWLTRWLRRADFGIEDVLAHKMPSREDPRMNSGVDGRGREGSESHYLVFAHTSPHGAIELMPWRESLGTYKFVGLAPILYDLTRGDGNRAVFVDEIGASLHPHLLFALVRSANETLENSEPCGQLIFATHDTSILDDEARDAVLRRDQIFLTDKDDCGASKLYSVAEFQERHNVNIRKRYLDGRYGALPAPSLMRF